LTLPLVAIRPGAVVFVPWVWVELPTRLGSGCGVLVVDCSVVEVVPTEAGGGGGATTAGGCGAGGAVEGVPGVCGAVGAGSGVVRGRPPGLVCRGGDVRRAGAPRTVRAGPAAGRAGVRACRSTVAGSATKTLTPVSGDPTGSADRRSGSATANGES
jgi:hypothetical protein